MTPRPPPEDDRGRAPPHPDDQSDDAVEAELARQRRHEEIVRAREAVIREARIQRQRELIQAEEEEERQLVAAIVQGGARLEEIDPRVLRSPKALVALELARRVADMALQHHLDASSRNALGFLEHTMNDEAASRRDRVTAAQTILSARAKMGAGAKHNGTEQLRQALISAGASREDVRRITDEELNERTRRVLAHALLDGE